MHNSWSLSPTVTTYIMLALEYITYYKISDTLESSLIFSSICAVWMTYYLHTFIEPMKARVAAGLAAVAEKGQNGAGLRRQFAAAVVCQFVQTLLNIHRVEFLRHLTCSTKLYSVVHDFEKQNRAKISAGPAEQIKMLTTSRLW